MAAVEYAGYAVFLYMSVKIAYSIYQRLQSNDKSHGEWIQIAKAKKAEHDRCVLSFVVSN